MRNIKLLGSIVLLNFIYVQSLSAQSKFDTLTSKLHQIFIKDSLPGASVVLVDAKQIIYEQNFGYADVEQKLTYSSKSVQNIGSVSKTFTAVALMKAIELGYFDLDTDINKVLPFKVVNPNFPDGVITIRQLCDHTSGIVDNPAIYPNSYRFDTDLANYDAKAFNALQSLGYQQKVEDGSLKTFMYDYLAADGKYYSKENFGTDAPGTTSSCSNIASALVAYLIEVRSGISYAKFTERYIFKPLKMVSSSWYIDRKKLGSYARPYYDLHSAFPFYHCVTYPDGGLRTNTTDLSKYLIAMINGYNTDIKLLNSISIAKMFTPQFSKENPPKGISLAKRNKGLFWNLYNNGTIGHDGDDPGVSSFLFFNPQTGLGGVFLCNKYLADKSEIVDLLFRYTR